MSTPLVSVLVPVYKVENYIAQCAESLFAQTWNNIEYIFVDNNSPDRSVSIIEEVLESYPGRKNQVKIIKETKQGLGNARRTALENASGEFLIHVDSDDWVEKDYVEKLVRKALDEDADVVFCDYYKEYEGRPDKTYIFSEKDLPGTDAATALFAIHNGKLQAYMWNKLEKRSLYHLDGFIYPITNMHEDIVIQTQALYNARKVVHLKEALYHYRRFRKGGITAGSWFTTRASSAKGLFHLYENLPKTASPLEVVEQDLVMRAAWYSISVFRFDILRSCPSAVRYISGMKFVKGRRVPLIKQYVMKYWCKGLILIGLD